jgi:hypothetical protein
LTSEQPNKWNIVKNTNAKEKRENKNEKCFLIALK